MPASINNYSLVSFLNNESCVANGYRTLRTNLHYMLPVHSEKTILVTSTLSGDGSTTTASNLAVVYAQENKKTLLIDGNFQHPVMHQVYGKPNRVGLANILAEGTLFDDAVQETDVVGLSLLTSGSVGMNPSDLIEPKKVSSLLQSIRNRYDIIIIDSAHALHSTETMIMAAECNGVVLVVNLGKTKRGDLEKTKAKLELLNANIVGIVLNRGK